MDNPGINVMRPLAVVIGCLEASFELNGSVCTPGLQVGT